MTYEVPAPIPANDFPEEFEEGLGEKLFKVLKKLLARMFEGGPCYGD